MSAVQQLFSHYLSVIYDFAIRQLQFSESGFHLSQNNVRNLFVLTNFVFPNIYSERCLFTFKINRLYEEISNRHIVAISLKRSGRILL